MYAATVLYVLNLKIKDSIIKIVLNSKTKNKPMRNVNNLIKWYKKKINKKYKVAAFLTKN